MKGRFVFHQILRFDGHGLYRRPNLQSDLHGHRHTGAHLHVLRVARKSSCRHYQVIGIEGDVRELEAPVAFRGNLPVKTAHGIGDFNRRPGYHTARRVFHHAFNRAGVTRLGLSWSGRKKQRQSKHHADTQTLEHFFSIPFVGHLCLCG